MRLPLSQTSGKSGRITGSPKRIVFNSRIRKMVNGTQMGFVRLGLPDEAICRGINHG